MDLSQLSTEDLMALRSGDLSRVSTAGLQALRGGMQPPKTTDISQLPGNIIPSAQRFASGLAQAVTHPVDTFNGVFDAVTGAVRNLAPDQVRTAIDSLDSPQGRQAAERASGTATAIGDFYKDRYGGRENILHTAITDPVGAAADLSTVLGLGGGAAKMAGMGNASQGLSRLSTLTNPLTAVGKAATAGAKGAGFVAKHGLGLSTGVGAENIAQAFLAGKVKNADFIDNLKGTADPTIVLDRAKQGLAEMARQKAAAYRANIASVKSDKTVLSFGGIDKSLTDANNIARFNGVVKNAPAARYLQQITDAVDEWKQYNPNQFHTPEGLDALKQRIGGIVEAIPFEEKTARLAAGKVYNSIKDEIGKQAPTYAATMKAYSDASDQIMEIERALSLGKKASVDTGMRKLQSLARNNVQTNYGNRLSLARELEDSGGVSLLPGIAGQALNSWTPRSLSGQLGAFGTLAAASQNPALAGILAAQSPRLVGGGAYALGAANRGFGNLLGQSGITPSRVQLGGLLGSRIGDLEEEGLLNYGN